MQTENGFMDEVKWANFYSTDKLYNAEIGKDILEQQGIHCVIVDKRDSAYGVFGEIELYVQRENVIRAKHIFSKNEIV